MALLAVSRVQPELTLVGAQPIIFSLPILCPSSQIRQSLATVRVLLTWLSVGVPIAADLIVDVLVVASVVLLVVGLVATCA